MYLPRFPFAQGSHFVPRRTCPDCLFPSSFSRPSARCAGLILSFSTDSRSGSIDFACVRGQGARYFRPSRRPRETQFLGACSAPAWSTLAARRYLGSFTPNVETESWHNFRRRRWRAQLTPFHASATIPPALSILRLALPCLAFPFPAMPRPSSRHVFFSTRLGSPRPFSAFPLPAPKRCCRWSCVFVRRRHRRISLLKVAPRGIRGSLGGIPINPLATPRAQIKLAPSVRGRACFVVWSKATEER